MRKILSLLALSSAIYFPAAAQSISESYTVSAADVDDSGFIVKKIWLKQNAVPQVSVNAKEYNPVNELPEGLATAAIEGSVQTILGMERKRPFVFVRIPAYGTTGSSQKGRLSSFTLQLTEQPQPEVEASPAALAKTTSGSSVLSSGAWYKISVAEQGVYKVDYDFLKNSLGVNVDAISPAMIRVFGNGGTMMYEANSVARPDDLTENAIQVFDGGDGAFNSGDYFIFYANGPMEWVKDSINQSFKQRKNLYEDKSYYFLNFDGGVGLRVEQHSTIGGANTTVTSYDDYAVHEKDEHNPGTFGKEWWGDEMSQSAPSRSVTFNVGSLAEDAKVEMYFASRSTASGNQMKVVANGQLLDNYILDATAGGEQDQPVTWKRPSFTLPLQNSVTFDLTYTPGTSTGKGYLNYILLNTRRQLQMHDGQFTFRDWRSVGAGKVANYTISGANGNTQVWDITAPLQPVRMSGSSSGNQYSFVQDAAMLHQFVAFDGSNYKTPSAEGSVPNQNLHGEGQVDYIIVTHPEFIDAANKLADHHRQHRGLRVVVAPTNLIYNEFGSGSKDISAIRDYVRMFYKRAGTDSSQMPRYLLLFGDASYDYKDRINGNTNFVPTYETAQSLFPLAGYCSDDFYSFLDDGEDIENETSTHTNTMDIGVGRLPVRTADEALAIVNKIMGYDSPASLGPWRISSTIVADNNDAAGPHMGDGELMAGTINNYSHLYNHTKVYVDALQKVSTPAGERCPDANKIINDQVYKGTFLINYNGHGSGQTLAHERVLSQDDFNNWKNRYQLPMMVTATCEFSRYDNPEFLSAGEKLILKQDGGAIALLTTTQLVFQSQNQVINTNFLSSQFRQYDGKWPTMGDAFRYGKNKTYVGFGNKDNFRKFALLGDPALVPAFPEHHIHTDSVLDGTTMEGMDSLKALGKYIIKGSVKDANGQLQSNFNGRLYVTIYDKPRTISTITAPARYFQMQNSVIYKGKVTVTNGVFSFPFVAPKDLNYDFGKGKISYYAENGVTDASGGDTTIVVGGFSDNPIQDDNAPIVKPFIGDSLFRNGGLTGSNTLLHVQFQDETGINVSGNSVGHDLVAVLDDDVAHPYILNDYYETAENDYTRGYVNFPITGLPDGEHSLRVKAWDMNNNSGEGTVYFEVKNGEVMAIQNLVNYPNPFTDLTHFLFEHNHPEEALNVQINIYNTAGMLVRTINRNYTPGTSRSNEITWDGTDNNGARLYSGMYLYRMQLTTEKGKQASAYQKLILIR